MGQITICLELSPIELKLGRLHLEERRLVILEPVGLVHHDVGPGDPLEEAAVLVHHLVVGQQHVEGEVALVVLALELPDDFPAGVLPDVRHHIDVRGPRGELLLPRAYGGEGHTHQHRALGGDRLDPDV